MGKSVCKYLIYAIVAMLCVFGSVGCSHQPTREDYEKVFNDHSLTEAQRTDRIKQLENETDPMAGTDNIAKGIFAASFLLLVVALIARNMMNKAALASASVSPTAKKKPVGPPAARPAPAQAPPPTYAPAQAPPPVYAAATLDPLAVRVKWPENQAELDAIPDDQLGISFFSSRPLPLDALVDVTILVGGRTHTVKATQQEVDDYRDGRSPQVRAFTVDGKTIPWYEWESYAPLYHYYPARHANWSGFINNVIPCNVPIEKLDPRLKGYAHEEDDGALIQGDDVLSEVAQAAQETAAAAAAPAKPKRSRRKSGPQDGQDAGEAPAPLQAAADQADAETDPAPAARRSRGKRKEDKAATAGRTRKSQPDPAPNVEAEPVNRAAAEPSKAADIIEF